MDLMEMIRNRRSVRTYRKGEIEEETLRKVLEAGLLAPSGRNRQPWELIVVRDPQTLKQLSECRAGGAARMLASAAAAVVVTADSAKTDVWTEDCSNAMMLMASDSRRHGSWKLLDPGKAQGSAGWKNCRRICERNPGISRRLPAGGDTVPGTAGRASGSKNSCKRAGEKSPLGTV